MTPAEIVQAQLDAYNARDAVKMAELYAEDCVLTDMLGNVTQQGRAAVRERYAKLFETYPQNRARIETRICLGNLVVDHEKVERSETERIEVVAIYTVRDGKIARLMMGKGE